MNHATMPREEIERLLAIPIDAAMTLSDDAAPMLVVCGANPEVPYPTKFSVDGKTCPRCGAEDVSSGFGLAGGGYGPYESCDSCDWFAKREAEE